jgi:hypothetical protein
MSDSSLNLEIGIGTTDELSLRVSVASLVRVLFKHPRDNKMMLALERRATLHETETRRAVEIKSQPFGGALRIHDPSSLRNLIGDFHFDSEESRAEQDFRIFIRPVDWDTVWQFCVQHLSDADDQILESNPQRELIEEFTDTLKIHASADQFEYRLLGTILENNPSPTENVYARGCPTVRIYRIFESHILDAALTHALMKNSESCSNDDLRKLALEDAQNGGKGWTNTILTLPLHQLHTLYEMTLPEVRNRPAAFHEHLLDETVAAILDHITVPKYKRLVL